MSSWRRQAHILELFAESQRGFSTRQLLRGSGLLIPGEKLDDGYIRPGRWRVQQQNEQARHGLPPCARCGGPIPPPKNGKVSDVKWCGPVCRRRAYYQKKKGTPDAVSSRELNWWSARLADAEIEVRELRKRVSG